MVKKEKFMELKMIIVTVILFDIALVILSFLAGYVKGFKKCKQIDDKIIEKLNYSTQ